MADLDKGKSVLNEQKILPLEREKIEEYLKKVESWNLSQDEKKIFRNFNFKTYREAIDFVNGVASFAEKINHYPDAIIIRFQKITIELATQSISGLSENDFILAKEIDAIAGWKKKLERWLVSPIVLIFMLIMLYLIILWQYRP